MTEKQMQTGLRAGDERALDAAIQTYSRLLWSISRAVLHHIGTMEDMEECVSDAFIQLWKTRENLCESRGSVKTWLCVVVKSRAIDRYRKIVQKNEIALEEQISLCGIEIVDQTMDAVLQRELIAAIQALGEPDREIIMRRFYYQQKPKEIAIALDLPIRQVENRIFRAKQKLRAQLDGGATCNI
ncbi:MAG: sigma-70 family RNA polymerase sigma factor [Clostridiaceae bacterium]